MTVKQWADAIGMNYNTLRGRIKHGFSVTEALTRMVQEHRNTKVKGEAA